VIVRSPAILPEACNRTRQHVSLRLDRQLSELEIAVMEHHLARCPACRTFADDLEGVTEALREADLVEPPIQFELPHRPSRFGVSRAGATAAAAILVAVALGGVSGLGPDAPSSSGPVANVPGDEEQGTLAEHFALVLGGSSAKARVTPLGVSAAELTTLGRGPVPGPSRGPR
jgi:predicted anti-sigma-YlaC factor YlaD